MKSAALFGAGLLVGAALAVIAIVSNWMPWPESRWTQPWNEAAYVARARVARAGEWEIPPHVDIYHGVALDPAGAQDVGRTSEVAQGIRFGCENVEMNSDVRAFHVWRGDGFTGDAAVFRLGPGRDEAGLRVYSFGDHGPSETTWDYPHASVRLSDWPVDRAGTIVAFEIEGSRDGKQCAFDGKFRVP